MNIYLYISLNFLFLLLNVIQNIKDNLSKHGSGPFHQGPFHHIGWRQGGVLKIIPVTNIK